MNHKSVSATPGALRARRNHRMDISAKDTHEMGRPCSWRFPSIARYLSRPLGAHHRPVHRSWDPSHARSTPPPSSGESDTETASRHGSLFVTRKHCARAGPPCPLFAPLSCTQRHPIAVDAGTTLPTATVYPRCSMACDVVGQIAADRGPVAVPCRSLALTSV